MSGKQHEVHILISLSPPHKKKINNNNNWMPPVGRKDRSIDFKMSLQKNPVRVISVAVNVAVV